MIKPGDVVLDCTKINDELKSRGMSKRKLAIAAGIAVSDLTEAINGRKPWYPAWRRRVAEALGMPEGELFTVQESNKSNCARPQNRPPLANIKVCDSVRVIGGKYVGPVGKVVKSVTFCGGKVYRIAFKDRSAVTVLGEQVEKIVHAIEITNEQADSIVQTYKPLGLFYTVEMGSDGQEVWVGIDNSDGNAWTEEFLCKEACIDWLARG